MLFNHLKSETSKCQHFLKKQQSLCELAEQLDFIAFQMVKNLSAGGFTPKAEETEASPSKELGESVERFFSWKKSLREYEQKSTHDGDRPLWIGPLQNGAPRENLKSGSEDWRDILITLARKIGDILGDPSVSRVARSRAVKKASPGKSPVGQSPVGAKARASPAEFSIASKVDSPVSALPGDAVIKSLKLKLKNAAHDYTGMNFKRLFAALDKTKSGQIDVTEFQSLIRKSARVTDKEVSDDSLKVIFQSMADGESGSISLKTLQDWIESESERLEREATEKRAMEARVKYAKEYDLQNNIVEHDVEKLVKNKLKAAAFIWNGCNGKHDWDRLFTYYADGYAFITLAGFKSMVRKDGRITAAEVPDRTLKKIFEWLDSDGLDKVRYPEFRFWVDDEDLDKPKFPDQEKAELWEFMGRQERERRAEIDKKEKAAFEAIRLKLQSAAYDVGGANWAKLFNRYDKEKTGEIICDDFMNIIRRDARVTAAEVSDKLLVRLFNKMDTDGDGLVSLTDFVAFIDPYFEVKMQSESDSKPSVVTIKQLNAWDIDDPLVKFMRQRTKAASYSLRGLDYDKLFDSYDQNKRGRLELADFRSLMRKEAKVTAEMANDAQLKTMYTSIDKDGSADDRDVGFTKTKFINWVTWDDQMQQNDIISGFMGS